MSDEYLKKRYLYIVKNSLHFLKEMGFQKKGIKYSKQNNELILEISGRVSRGWLNSENSYEFQIGFELITTNRDFIDLYMFMEGEKNLTKAPLIWGSIHPVHCYNGPVFYLNKDDPIERDDQLIKGFKEKIEKRVVAWSNTLVNIDDVMHLAEEELKIEREKRIFWRHTNIYRHVADFYASKGWIDKTFEMCEKYIEMTPITARDLGEKRVKKYKKYFDMTKRNAL